MPPPLSIYFLGDNKLMDARKKLMKDIDLANFLDKIIGWNPFENPILPEILFHFEQSLARTSDKIYEKLSAKLSSGRSLTSRSGPTDYYSAAILKRDLNSCVFCEATENLSAARLLTFKGIDDRSLDAVFAKCHVASVQDIGNGVTACENYHDLFDFHLVRVNADTMRVEVSGALLNSDDPKVREKWGSIDGKYLKARSTMGHWSSVEAFRERYNVFINKRDVRRAKQSELRFQCEQFQKRV